MPKFSIPLALIGLVVMSRGNAATAVRYVDVNNSTPVAPYTTWATASTTLQEAVDASLAGDEILVTNGVYQNEGQAVVGLMTNRVAVTKPVTVRSVSGPEVTWIVGHQGSGVNRDGAVRCVYLANDAKLIGFTLTNGSTRTSGAFPHEMTGGGVWCESASAVVSNCLLTANRAAFHGGGAVNGTLIQCTLTDNSAMYGGGAANATLGNCTLEGNQARSVGGALYSSIASNCRLTGNSAELNGGGANGSMLNNCTLTGNSSGRHAGGAGGSWLTNCIVYYNTAVSRGANYAGGYLSYCCTTPLPPDGVGNIIAEPELTDAFRLSAGSPCHAAGSPAYANGKDIDGEPWNDPPSIGCDEYHAGGLTGPLTVAIEASYTHVATEFRIDLRAQLFGKASVIRWEFGDGTISSNRPYTSHAWAAAGDYTVILWAYNESHLEGVSVTQMVHVVERPIHYVALDSLNPVPPHQSWATAAANIQDAVDSIGVVGALIVVSNGVYKTGGGRIHGNARNRVAVMQPMIVQSLNGPGVTMIDGQGEGRCVYLTNGAALIGMTLTNGLVPEYELGGGVWCESVSAMVSNCTIIGNLAGNGGGAAGGTLKNCALTANVARGNGGGAYQGTLINCVISSNVMQTYGGGGANDCVLNNCVISQNVAFGDGGGSYNSDLNNCLLTGNSATRWGGGASIGRLSNCTLTGNRAYQGGGTYGGRQRNCIVFDNTADLSDANTFFGSFYYCCTTPPPAYGSDNFTNAPLFVDPAGGNFRLQPTSPCINAGKNAYSPSSPDLDGLPRIVGGSVDVGSYEFQNPMSLLSYAWLQQYGLPLDSSADHSDEDGDRLDNSQEWRAGTDPTNAVSVLRLLAPMANISGLAVTWQSVSNRVYFLNKSTNISGAPEFQPWLRQVPGQEGTTTVIDHDIIGAGPVLYRVGVQE